MCFFLDRFRSVTGFSQATARYEPRFGTGNTRFSSSRKKFRAAMRRTMLDVFALRFSKEMNKHQVQLNKYKTEPYFLHFFLSNTTVCLIIYVFCKSCDHECEPEPEIVLKSKQ